MTKAKLIVYTDWDSDRTGIGSEFPEADMEIDIEVNDGDEPVIITINSQTVSMNSKTEPRIVLRE